MNALTKQLADALRECVETLKVCENKFVRYTPTYIRIGTEALAAFDAAEDPPKLNASRISTELAQMAYYIELNPDNATSDTLWHVGPETMMDALLRLSDEVGKLDAAKDAPEDDALTVAYMAGSASRLDELRARDAEIAELKRKLGSLRRQINEMDNETGDEVDTAFMQAQRARSAQKKAEAERDAALKASHLNLQPLHELVKKWTEYRPSTHFDRVCLHELREIAAKIQSAGVVKP